MKQLQRRHALPHRHQRKLKIHGLGADALQVGLGNGAAHVGPHHVQGHGGFAQAAQLAQEARQEFRDGFGEIQAAIRAPAR